MEIASLDEFLEADCELQYPTLGIFIGIYHTTNGRPCDDCAMRHNCKERHDLEQIKAGSQVPRKRVYTETNRQIADRLGISKRQVSKMRKAGEL